MLFGDFFLSVKCRASKSLRRNHARTQDERGVVLVMVTLLLTVVMGCVGMAVDLGNWYWNINKIQNAADAASLAAAPFLPGDVDGARQAAAQALQSNGIGITGLNDPRVSLTQDVHSPLTGADRFADHVYLHQDPNDKNVMQVQVGRVIHNYFISMLGINEERLVRTGSASYKAEIPMGSPSAVLGSEPAGDALGSLTEAASLGRNGKYWLNLSGPGTDKTTGDQFGAGTCTYGFNSNCSTAGKNLDVAYDGTGQRSHRFTVHVPKGSTKPVTVQVFDGAFVNVGNTCETTAPLQAAAAATGQAARFATGAGEFCTGDYNQGYSSSSTYPGMTVSTYKAAAMNSLGTKVGSVVFPSVSDSANIASLLSSGHSGDASHPSLSDSFRAWSTVATLTQPGDYVIEVKTTSPTAAGANRFSMRAGVIEGTTFSQAASKGVTIAASGHLAVYTNATAADTSFYFAKLTSNAAGRVIDVNLYDIGDASNGDSVDAVLVPPSGAAASIPNGFNGICRQVGPENNYSAASPDCSVRNASPTRYNGRTVTLKVTVPENYVCDDTTGSDCWMSLRFIVRGANQVSSSNPSQDTTTWSVEACGRPVALVANQKDQRKDACPEQAIG